MATAIFNAVASGIPNISRWWSSQKLHKFSILRRKTIVSMNIARWLPEVVYFRDCVLFAGNLRDMNHIFERLTMLSDLPLQWIVANSKISVKSNIVSLFNQDLLISCKMKHLFVIWVQYSHCISSICFWKFWKWSMELIEDVVIGIAKCG